MVLFINGTILRHNVFIYLLFPMISTFLYFYLKYFVRFLAAFS